MGLNLTKNLVLLKLIIKMHKKFSLFIVLQLLLLGISYAQNNSFEYSDTAIYKVEESQEETYETITYENNIKIPDTTLIVNTVKDLKDSVQQWKKDKKLAYLQKLDSLLAEQQAKEDASVNNTLDTAQKGISFFDRILGSGFFQFLLWLIAGVALFFILYKLFLSKGIFSKNDKEVKNVEEVPEMDLLHLGNYERLIEEAIQKEDYRLATRYLFLQSLKHLADKEIIFYAADKTNSEYLQLLPEHLKESFRNINRHYDYIWYGRQTIEKNIFQNIQQIFKQFNQTF